MDNNPWSERNIRPGTTFTDKREFKDLNERAKERKKYFHPLRKSGSRLEVYGENQRVVINELSTYSAAIWYGLYDGTILDVVKDEDKKSIINQLLQKYFIPPSLPIIPVLRTDENRDPKYKLKGDKTRIYSVHGGANLRTFLGISNSDPYRGDRFLDTFSALIGDLQSKGIKVPWQIPQNTSTLQTCEFYLNAQAVAKEQLAVQPDADEETKRKVVELELFSKLHVALEILDELGIYHGHPHGGNIVVSWSRHQLTQSDLERQLVNPTQISVDYPEMINIYPNCFIYPSLIDFDKLLLDPQIIGDGCDEQKLFGLLNDHNEMHRVLALHLLPIEKWPKEFLISLTTSNIGLVDEVSLKLRSLFWDGKVSPKIIRAFFVPFLELGVGFQDKVLKRLLSEIVPGKTPHNQNIVGWGNWITFFKDNPNLSDFKNAFIESAMEEFEVRDKSDLFRSIDGVMSHDRVNSGDPLKLISNWINRKRYNVRQILG